MRQLREVTKKTTRTMAVFALPLALIAAGLATLARTSAAQEAAASDLPTGLLMVVRAWEPKTGELIGWMPMHRVALTLRQVGKEERTPTFDLNEAVTLDFPYRPKDAAKYGRLLIHHETATFQGREWTPLEQAPNLVRIRGFIFCVKSIDFVESKWRAPAVVGPVTQMLRK
ncbi:MAG TPA: hypothetical protein VG204_17785 [Terriglobia bacterium]|nr:hypothetical protein [Terriglobia bacterium]